VYIRAFQSAEDFAIALAHEIGHSSGLGLNDPVHNGHSDDPGNLMYGFLKVRTGTAITDAQKQVIRQAAARRARNTQHGRLTDALGYGSRAHLDRATGWLFAETLGGDLEIAIVLAGLHPSGAVRSRFQMLFDVDDDRTTGGTFGPFAGVDKVLDIALVGGVPFTAPGALTVSVLDVASGTPTAGAPR